MQSLLNVENLIGCYTVPASMHVFTRTSKIFLHIFRLEVFLEIV